MSRAFITIVRDPNHPLGKQFELEADGNVNKQSNVKSALLIAQTVQAETPEAFAEILRQVGDDTHAAIMNSYIPGTEDGAAFVILSIAEAGKRLGLPADDRTRLAGEHSVVIDGREYRAFLRIKENMAPSPWILFDRDVDMQTPAEFATQGLGEWRAEIADFIPGFNDVSFITVPSASSRVLHKGQAIGQGNGHLWVMVKDPHDIDRFRIASKVAAIKYGKSWAKPRFSRTEPGKKIAGGLATIFDESVFVVGRLAFEGKPTAGPGLEVIPQSIMIQHGTQPTLDTESVKLDDPETIRTITRNSGVEMDVRSSGGGLVTVAHDLTLDTELETEQFGTITVRAYLALGLKTKVRCQAPFRSSSSFAAFIALDTRGHPFVFDSGTNTTHRLVDSAIDGFEPCDYEVIDGEAVPSMPPNPFEKFSLLGKSGDIEKQAGEEKMLLGNLAVLGQLTVFYADPNTGKTLIVMHLLSAAIRAGRVKASQVFYVNVDDNLNGLVQKLRVAEEFGFHMVADGHQGFKVTDFVATVTEIIEQDQVYGVVIILDTLKKFSNLMDKARTTGFNKILRRLAMKGGTVIALAHTNKKRDPDGKPIYAGTSDVLEDFDCGYLMMERKGGESAGKKVVAFENIKRRGNVAMTAAYAYSTDPDQTYDQLLASVEEVGEVEFLSLQTNKDIVAEKAIIHAIVDLIGSGTNTKMALAEAVAARVGISKRKALQVLEKYTGTDPAFGKWTFEVKERGAKVFVLLPEFAAAAAVTEGVKHEQEDH